MLEALKATWPVMVGYFPMGMAFGILCGNVLLSFLSGSLVFAGASQFLSVRLMADNSTLMQIWVSTFFLNLRHVFYSLHFLSRYRRFSFLTRLYAIFALTDETYAILVHHKRQDAAADSAFVWRVSWLNQMTWVAGCTCGALLKTLLNVKVKGLDFFLIGLFVVLLVEQMKKDRNNKAFVFSTGVGIVALYSKNSLWLFWAMAICVFYGLFVIQEQKK
jgi:4-azaleucine resistance transporter AzlC